MSNVAKVLGPKPHPHSVWLYWGVFLTLIVLTILTVMVAQHDFGELNIVVALLIASFKAALVAGFFMHLLFDSKFLSVVLCTSLVLLALFLLFPILDFSSRADLDSAEANFLPRDQEVYKYELEHPDQLPLRPGLQQPQKDELIFIGPGHH
ncbi:MAG TPA: cytochrome C oxidase subunit IV family protein [Myxococcota bacterium]|nr:cytochrome C oxidase subunit IV family protein [Myxococcota bacterium]